MRELPSTHPSHRTASLQVEVLAWHVKPGDKVAQFDKLLEVQSDKATVEITSRYDGVVRTLHHAVGQMAPTGKPLLDIETEEGAGGGEDAAAASSTAGAAGAGGGRAAPACAAAAAAAAGGGSGADNGSLKTLATPAVRRIAREHDLSLSAISGTGKDGRVLKEDILRFVAGGGAAAVAAPAPVPAPAPTPAPALSPAAPVALRAAPLGGAPPADVVLPVRGLARAMARAMTTAWEAPHFGYCDEVVVDGLMAVRAALKPAAEAAGLKLSFLPIILKATSLALAAAPGLNGHVSPDASQLTQRGAHNIGVAMDTPRGLIVPNVKGVQGLSILQIAAELARLQALAAAGKLGEADLTDGTFTCVEGGLGGVVGCEAR